MDDVMVPLDGTPESADALPTAMRLARALGSGVLIVRVFDVSQELLTARAGMLGATEEGRAMRREMEHALDAAAKRVEAAHIPVATALLDGSDVPRTLLAYAAQARARAIVMMTHARGALGRAVLGSVSDPLRRHAALPVVLIPPGARAAATTDVERPLRRVLVAGDGSSSSNASAAWLRALADRGVELVHFRAVDPAHRVAEILAAAGTDVDLIAMTGRDRRGLARLAQGSTADGVLHGARVPVLFLPSAAG